MPSHHIRVQRLVGGLGDVICSTVVCRAVREKYPDAHITFCTEERYLHLISDQYHMGADDIIAPSKTAYGNRLQDHRSIKDDGSWDRVIDCEGPEIRYAQKVRYDIQESRTLTWCKSADHVPADLSPRWIPRPKERQYFIANQLNPSGLKPFSYVVVQWASAMAEKFYPHVKKLVEILRDRGHQVLIVHNKKVPDCSVDAEFDEKGNRIAPDRPVWELVNAGILRHIALFVEQAKLVIGPDSSLIHLAAATRTPALGLFGPTNGEVITKHYPLCKSLQYDHVSDQACAETFPCWGVSYRNYWCRERPYQVAWCLEKLSPKKVADQAELMIEQYRDYNQEKLIVTSTDDRTDTIESSETFRNKSSSRKLYVAVPSGIGDVLWALTKMQAIQKEAPNSGTVLAVCDGIPRRSVQFLKQFDFIEDAKYAKFSIHPPNVKHVNEDGTYNYIPTHREFEGYDWLLVPNATLERGVRLEKWLPEFETNWKIGVENFHFSDKNVSDAAQVEMDISNDFVIFFMGALVNNTSNGHNRQSLWTSENWLRLGALLYENHGLDICLVGAPYDQDYVTHVAKVNGGRLPKYWHNHVGVLEIGATYDLCRRSKGVVSFQSGIGIFSAFLGIPTAMWWRPYKNSISPQMFISFQDEMRNAWVPPWAQEKQYLGYLYSQVTPEQMVHDMESRDWFGMKPPHYWAQSSSHPLRESNKSHAR